jgi:DNA-binding CsgD family transcriptional regulator
MIAQTDWRGIARALRLSPRELEIAMLVFDDLKELAIARELGISHHTVHTHLERLFKKLRVASRTGLLVHIFATYMNLFPGSRSRLPSAQRRSPRCPLISRRLDSRLS